MICRCDKPWALVVHLDRPAGRADEAAALREAIHEYFGQRVLASSRKLRELFRRGRISLVIALAFLTASIAVGDAVAGYLGDGRLAEVIREGFLIGGWVAMWRPLEVFLYDWWPIRADGRLLQRLSTIPVRIEYKGAALLTRGARIGPKSRPQTLSVSLQLIRSKTSEPVGMARIVTQTCGHFRGVVALLLFLSDSAEPATAIQRIESETSSDVVPNAFRRKGNVNGGHLVLLIFETIPPPEP